MPSKLSKDIRENPTTYSQKWIDIHALAASIETEEDIEPTIKAILTIITKTIKCKTCYEHATKYLKDNPVPRECTIKDFFGRPMDVFYYFVDFHNFVNMRLGKPHMETAAAIDMYYNTENNFCNSVCGN